MRPAFPPVRRRLSSLPRVGGDMPGFVLKRLDRKVEKLNLTPEQQAKYDELRAQLKERLLAAKEDRLKFRETVRTELAKESPDVAVLNAMIKKKIEGVSGALQDGLDLFVRLLFDPGRRSEAEGGGRNQGKDGC